jgi:hypothetical protein
LMNRLCPSHNSRHKMSVLTELMTHCISKHKNPRNFRSEMLAELLARNSPLNQAHEWGA